MKLEIFPNGIYGAITYLIYDEISKDAAIVDCTSSINEIKKITQEQNLNVKYILITHGHFDHVYCTHEMKKTFPDALVLMHKDDLELLENLEVQCSIAGVENTKIPCVDGLVDENSKNLKLGNQEIEVISTKGHSKGGVCYLIDKILFSGDTLFQNSIGRYDLWGGSETELKESITKKLFTLDEDIIVYPGHGDFTTIKEEKINNPYFGERYC